MAERKPLAITALMLGILGLFTAGGLLVGSLLGLVLAVVVLTRSRAGHDLAWAAVAANLVALLTVFPVAGALWTGYAASWAFASDDDALPEPVGGFGSRGAFVEVPPPPPPPPPAPSPVATPIEVGGSAVTSGEAGPARRERPARR